MALLAGFYLLAVQSKNLALVILLVVLVQGILFQMWNATFATFYQEHFPMRIRVTGFAVAQNIGLMVASFFPSIFTAIAPPGSTNVPLVIGSVTFGITRCRRHRGHAGPRDQGQVAGGARVCRRAGREPGLTAVRRGRAHARPR